MLEVTRLLPTLLPAILGALKQVVTEIGQQLPEILKLIVEFIETDASSLMESWADIMLMLIEVLTEPDVLSSLIEAGVTMLVTLQEGLWKAIPKVVEALPKIVDNLIKALLNSIPLIIEAGVKLFVSLVQNMPAIISGIIQAVPKIMLSIFSAFSPFSAEMGKIFSAAWEGIKQIFSLDRVGGFFAGVWNGIKSAFSYVTDWFKNIFSDAWESIKRVFSATGETFGQIGRSILNGISTVINGIINGINQVIKVPFDGLNAILRTIKDINIAGLKPFSWMWEISVPQMPSIPMLAEGGVLKRGQIALLEGQGDEAVIPLSKNTEWMDGVADRISDRLNNDGSQNITINVDVENMSANSKEDIDALAEILIQAIAEKTARRRVAF